MPFVGPLLMHCGTQERHFTLEGQRHFSWTARKLLLGNNFENVSGKIGSVLMLLQSIFVQNIQQNMNILVAAMHLSTL